jgi:RecA-family ATPase
MLTLNKREAETQLQVLDEEVDVHTFVLLAPEIGGKRSEKRMVGTLDVAWPAIEQLNRKGWDCYITVQDTDRRGRKKPNITRLRALFRENDNKGQPQEPFPFDWHMEIESSPGKSHDYLLIEGCPDKASWEGAMKIMVDHYGSDPNAKDCARILRLAGTYNHKYDPPAMVHVTNVEEYPPVRWEDFKARIPLLELERKKEKAAARSFEQPLYRTENFGKADFRNSSIASIAGKWHRQNLPLDQARVLATHFAEERFEQTGEPFTAEEAIGVVESIYRSAGPIEGEQDVVLSGAPVGLDCLLHEPPAPAALVDGLLPIAPWGLVGAGGAMKTSLGVHMAISLITGREVLGQLPPKRTGACVFVTKEDGRDQLMWRVHKICKAMGLTLPEQRRVAEGLMIEDLTGRNYRLVDSSREGNLEFSPLIDHLVSYYQGRGVVSVMFDPTVYFGPGERFVNDGDAMVMQAGRAISNQLACTVGFLHHMSKQGARDNVVDQHAGRGSSAFGDNSRAMLVATRQLREQDMLPEGITKDDMDDERVVLVHQVKYSYGKRMTVPIWVLRDQSDAWSFRFMLGLRKSSDEAKAMVKEQRLADRLRLKTDIFKAVGQLEQSGQYPTRTAHAGQIGEMVGCGKNKVTELMNEMLATGVLREEPVPENLRVGGRKTYLVPGRYDALA